MGNLVLSNNGLYLISEDKIYFATENRSYSINEISVPKWIDILNENTQFSIKNQLVEVKEIISYHRRVTYQLMESLNFDLKSSLMMEYEFKFGNLLLNENTVLIEGWLSDAWNWTKDKVAGAFNWVTDKVKEFGSFAVKTGKDFISCVTGKGCSPLFEDFREMLYSPVGIAIETFLSVTGIGSIGPIVAWGMMLLWDSYLLISGDKNFSWLNLIFDILGVGLGTFAKTSRALFGGAAGVQKTAGKSIVQIISDGMKNSKTAGIMVKLKELLGSGLSKIMGPLQTAGKFMSEKLGLKWIGKALDGVSSQIAKILEAFGVKAVKNTTKAGVKSAIKSGSLAQGIMTAADTKVGRNVMNKTASLFGANPYDDIIKANEKYAVDYSAIEI